MLAGMGGIRWYFRDASNSFDFILVVTSLPEAFAHITDNAGSINLSVLRVMRLLRIFRAFRSFRLLRSMKEIVDVVFMAFKAIANLLVFMTFAIMIGAIVAMNILGGKMEDEEGLNPRLNFDTFFESCLSLFVIMTGENWTSILFDALSATPVGGVLVLLWFVFSNYVLLQTFAAVILENFALSHEDRINLQVALFQAQVQKRLAHNKLRIEMENVLTPKNNKRSQDLLSGGNANFLNEGDGQAIPSWMEKYQLESDSALKESAKIWKEMQLREEETTLVDTAERVDRKRSRVLNESYRQAKQQSYAELANNPGSMSQVIEAHIHDDEGTLDNITDPVLRADMQDKQQERRRRRSSVGFTGQKGTSRRSSNGGFVGEQERRRRRSSGGFIGWGPVENGKALADTEAREQSREDIISELSVSFTEPE